MYKNTASAARLAESAANRGHFAARHRAGTRSAVTMGCHPGDASPMQIIYRAESIIDANLVKAALETAGIMAFINGEYLTGGIGELPVSGLVNVMVADIDIERAQPIAEEVDAALRAEVDPADGRFFDTPAVVRG